MAGFRTIRAGLVLVSILVVATGVRFRYLSQIPHDDVTYYTAWTYRMLHHGLGAAYGKGGIYEELNGREVRLPPCNNGVLHCGLFYAVGNWLYPAIVGRAMDLETTVDVIAAPETQSKRIARVLFKLPALLADLAMVAILGWWTTRRHGLLSGSIIAASLALHPAMVLNSAAWGQIDAWHTLFLACCVMALSSRRFLTATAAITLALLFKLQAIVLLPIVFACVAFGPQRMPGIKGETAPVATFRREDLLDCWKRVRPAVLLATALVAGCWLPWLATGAGRHILDPYLRTVGQYRYSTVNAFNLYWLLEDWDPAQPIDFTQATDDREPILTFMGVGVSYRVFGLALVLLSTGWICWRLHWGEYSERAIENGCLLQCLAFFLFATEMHERYLYPAIAVWAVCYRPSIRWWCIWLVLGAAVTANMACFFAVEPVSLLGAVTAWLSQDVLLAGRVTALALLATFGLLLCDDMLSRAACAAFLQREEHREPAPAPALVTEVHAPEV